MSLDFDAVVSAPFRMQPGLRRLAPGAVQLTPSRPGGRSLREKLAVLSAFPRQALLMRDGFDAGPALARLVDHAVHEHPHALEAADSGLAAPLLGWRLHHGNPQPMDSRLPEVGAILSALPVAWRTTALLCLAFEEDFAIVDGSDSSVPWLAVCLPSHWAPEDKVGRHFAEVHAPVADNRLLLAAGEHLLNLVCGEERWERFVWTLTPHTRLHAHPARADHDWPEDASPAQLAAACRFRTERQTFIPIPGHGQAVFTIHVDIEPLAEAIALPGRAARLAAALASMSPAVLQYRGLTPARDPLLAWLADQA